MRTNNIIDNHTQEYSTFAEAQADGWMRAVNIKYKRDVSGGNSFGYKYELPNGVRSQTVHFRDEKNKIKTNGCYSEMFRSADVKSLNMNVLSDDFLYALAFAFMPESNIYCAYYAMQTIGWREYTRIVIQHPTHGLTAEQVFEKYIPEIEPLVIESIKKYISKTPMPRKIDHVETAQEFLKKNETSHKHSRYPEAASIVKFYAGIIEKLYGGRNLRNTRHA
jgi:hypothetical protein